MMPWDQELEPDSPAYLIASSEAPRLRVVAGPGTGKSFAMKRRVARLLESGVNPEDVLAVTFTRVAAEDLHRELVQMDVEGADQLRATTLHSLALRSLMQAHVLMATGRTPRPLNDFEVKPLMADLAGQFGGLKSVKRLIKAFEAAWARRQHDEPGELQDEDLDFQIALGSWLDFHRAMLIGEVIPIFLDYLRNDPLAPERTMFSHILVDEYQDLNRAEQTLIALLSENSEVCIVGDDDQSIYSFRHAHPEGIREWGETEQFEPDDLGLDECRRCPTRVVNLANSLIQHNQNRDAERQLDVSEANGDGLVRSIRYGTVNAEVQGVAGIVDNLIVGGAEPGSILILAPRIIGTPIYEALVEREIPAKSYYAEAELESEFAQERYSYLKLLVDDDDRVALRWLVGLYGNNWHAAGYRRVRQHCEGTNLSPWQVFEGLSSGEIALPFTAPIVVRFEEVKARVDHLRALLLDDGLQGVVDDLFPEEEPQTKDLRALLTETLLESPDAEPEEFLRLVNDAITKPEIPEQIEEVRIMSLYKSKGLSAGVTIVAGCVEGALPRRPSGDLTQAERAAVLEEQRRLLYVGITRVKATPAHGILGTLILTSAREMPLADAMHSGIVPAQIIYDRARLLPSRFFNEFGGHLPPVELG